MNRAHPVFSRVGCLSGLLLAAAVGLAIALTGGAIFSPGALTAFADNPTPAQPVASHAAIGNDCAQCHAPFAGVTAERCEACHDTVAQQRAAGTGLHGALPAAEVGRCAQCHSDHRGAGFDPSAGALDRFDHETLGFSLARHTMDFDETPLDCAGCHRAADFQFEPATCVECHGQADTTFMAQHVGAFGTGCLACHDGVDALAAFDHAQTAFPLDGAHAPLACTACHTPAQSPADRPADCAGCHAEPPIHAGLFGTQCAACHTTTAWAPAQLVQHRFPLDHGGQGEVACATCHTETYTAYTCYGCHEHQPAEMQAEHAEEGIGLEEMLDCAVCHPAGEED